MYGCAKKTTWLLRRVNPFFFLNATGRALLLFIHTRRGKFIDAKMDRFALVLQGMQFDILDGSPPADSLPKIFDRTLTYVAKMWQPTLVPATDPGPVAIYYVIIKMKADYCVIGVDYYNKGSKSEDIPVVYDGETVEAFYSDDGSTWSNIQTGYRYHILPIFGKTNGQKYEYKMPVTATYWKFEIRKYRCLA